MYTYQGFIGIVILNPVMEICFMVIGSVKLFMGVVSLIIFLLFFFFFVGC